MPLYQLFSQLVRVEYKARVFSRATAFAVICWVAKILLPLVVVYRSEGIWLKSDSYIEQPDVNFKHDMLLMIELQEPNQGKTLVWSTFPKFQAVLEGSSVRAPQISAREIDSNNDGKYDELNLELSLPLTEHEEILQVRLFLFFDYKLRNKVKMQMESMVSINYRPMSTGSKLIVIGDLRLHQKELMSSRGYDFRFNHSIIGQFQLEEFSVDKLLRYYLRQNVTTRIGANAEYIWESGRDRTRDDFKLDLTLLYATETIFYKPGLWYLLKWAWVQYFCVYIIFYYVINWIMGTVFQNQMVNTIVHYSKIPPAFGNIK